jgi:hypothetical protein
MKSIFHGTSGEAGNLILSKGFSASNFEKNWNCSNNPGYTDKIFFYELEKIKEVYRFETNEEAKNESVLLAFEAGQISAALNKSKLDYLYVFQFDIEDEFFKENFIEDLSCENMEGAYCCSETIANRILKDKEFINAISYKFYYDSSFRFFILVRIYQNNLLNKDLLSYTDKNILNQLRGGEIYIEEISEEELIEKINL